MAKSRNNVMLMTLLILIWGACWPTYKSATPYIPPLFYAALRSLGGGLLLALFLWNIRDQIQFKKNWKIYSISALFNAVLFLGIQTVGLNYLPGGLFSILVYFQPVIVGILSWLMLKEVMTPLKLAGLFLGFIGVLVVSYGSITLSFQWIGILLAFLTAFSWAFGVVYIKKYGSQVNAYWIVSMQFIIGGFFLLIGSLLTEDVTTTIWNGYVIVSSLFGITVGLPATYLIYYKLIREGEASKVATYTFLVPIVASFVGVVGFGEPMLSSWILLGILFVGTSIITVNRTASIK